MEVWTLVQHTVRTITLPGDGLAITADRWTTGPPEPGRPPALVLVPGGGQTRHTWRATARALVDSGRDVVALDLRGHGDSAWCPAGDYSLDAFARDLTAAVRTLGGRPVLVGASVGGLAALVAQGDDPELARALVLLDIAPKIEVSGSGEIAAFMRSAAGGFDTLDDAAAAFAAFRDRDAPSVDRLRRTMRERDGRWYWHWDAKILDFIHDDDGADAARRHLRSLTAARRITVPTLIVRGADSTVVSEEGVQELTDALGHAELVNLEGVGHMRPGDDNDPFGAVLFDFLDRLA